MDAQTLFPPLVGGGLIGLAASLLLLSHGRVADISGIVGGLMGGDPADRPWRVAFTAGLLVAGLVAGALAPQAFASEVPRSPAALAAAGLLVGYGARLGNGCTSGHGVCGIGRGSRRSLAATATFMAAGAAVVAVVRVGFGGTL